MLLCKSNRHSLTPLYQILKHESQLEHDKAAGKKETHEKQIEHETKKLTASEEEAKEVQGR